MRKMNFVVFDDYIPSNVQVFTAQSLNDRLGLFDKLSIEAVADNVAGTSPTITVQIQHSSDNRNWVNKNTTAEINAAGISVGSTTPNAGSDTSSAASLGFVRLAITLGGSSPSAHVKIWVTARDTVQ